MKKLFLLFFILSALAGQAQRYANPKPFAKDITVEDMQRHLYIIAGAGMEGRETATEGQRKAAAYIEKEFKLLELAPGNNNNSYEMYFPVYADSLLDLALSINDTGFIAGRDFSVNLADNNPASFRFSEVVFAGYGLSDSTHDDYEGIDVKGKLVMVWSEEVASAVPAGSRRGFSGFTQQMAAMKNGAAALLVINKHITPTAVKGNMYVNRYRETQRINTFYISETLAQKMIGPGYAAQKTGSKPQAYAANIALSFNKATITMQSSNVLGILEGSDLKDEYVVLTAHYDHLGKRDDTIWYGADDDGSGTVTILELAKAFKKAKAAGKGPRRSILFMTVSGEEKGLWGSDYYSSNPALPLEKTTVNLNIDMIGRIDPSRKHGNSANYIYIVGDDKLSSDLKPISEAVNKKYSKLELDYKYNDPKDPERIYYRSDHYNFAKKGVPVIFYFSGLHPDYHKPSDTPDKINYHLMQKRAQLIFFTAWDMANRNGMLKRDIPLQ
ncbi:M28 family peptidase [Agriterribacter sp.]|uniref:M28 family peptidase n=1 Tax=Agriterribacter sp. TaxID=2821509 RepID=UPI002C02F4DA|nr:M28 family peptidase [Agriterribacter sp.]HRO44893.1 M28 family peptidase [Agriterribacter sp.]